MSSIKRHITAISRNRLSMPVSLAISKNIINKNTTIFDMGCGRGDDLRRLSELGFTVSGYDPYYFPQNKKQSVDIVILNYVVNVIEDIEERTNVILEAISLCKIATIISVRLKQKIPKTFKPFNDGYITSKNTFQKFYSHKELVAYIETITNLTLTKLTSGIIALWRV